MRYFLLNANEIFAFQDGRDLVWIITAGQKYLATQAKGLSFPLTANNRSLTAIIARRLDYVRT